MTEPRRLRSGTERPWYQPPPPRQRPSAPAASAVPAPTAAPAAAATLAVESDDDDDDETIDDAGEDDEEGGGKEGGGEGGDGEDEDGDDTDSVVDYSQEDGIFSGPPRHPADNDPGVESSSRPPPVPRRESKEDSNEDPVAEKCDHTIHPAYADFYPHLLCPLCRLEKTIKEGLRPAQILIEKGGEEAWNNEIHTTTKKDSVERKRAIKYFHSIVPPSKNKSGKPKPFDSHVDEDGNISFTRARTGAWNRIWELEMFRDVENAWYEIVPLEKLEGPLRVRVLDAWKHDATIALTRWEKEYREAVSDSVIKQDDNINRKRARENELVLRDDFPGPDQDRDLTQEQQEWVEAGNAAEGWTLESGACPQQKILPPRKRRRVGLRFDTHVYVRSDYGLNSGLFRPRPPFPDAAPPSHPPPPGEMNPPPTRPYYTEAMRAGPGRRQGLRRRIGPITIEKNRIDTSGGYRRNKNWDKWEAYTAALEAEDERSEEQKETETELLRLYDLVARLRHSGLRTESKEALVKAYEHLAWALEVARRSSLTPEGPEEQLRREMADEERRRQPQQPGPHGGMAIAVTWFEHARGIAQEYLRRLAENTGL